PVPQHLLQHEPREPVLLPIPRQPHPLPIVAGNVDRSASRQLPRGILPQLHRNASHQRLRPRKGNDVDPDAEETRGSDQSWEVSYAVKSAVNTPEAVGRGRGGDGGWRAR